ncbi:SDR family oxidoreductase [Nocardia sp. NPDC051756]|uniref:SDR family oxidoreductase n=1 Tax=Nocardia sp. NPDC051756 TaxID=3154751 RepID=UPI00341E3C67
MSGEFTGKNALVTGGGKGIGRAICLRLAEQGAHVLVNYFHSANDARSTLDEILRLGGSAELVQGSVADEESVHTMFRTIADRHGGLDILINNAARGTLAPMSTLRNSDWSKALAVNLDGSRRCAQAAAALMAGRDGSIVNLSSIGAGLVIGNYATVGVSKAALEALTRYLAVEFAAAGIRVNTASAGLVDNDTSHLFPDSDVFRQTVLAATPLGRLATEADLTEIVLFLASDRASFITGQVILADGGLALGSASLTPPAEPARAAAVVGVPATDPPTPPPESTECDDQLVAVVGTGMAIAGANSPQEFWSLLSRPRPVFTEPGERFSLENFYAADRAAVDRTYCRVGGHLHDFHPHPALAAEESADGPLRDEATRWLRHSLLQARDGVHSASTDRCAVYVGAWPGGSQTLPEHLVTQTFTSAVDQAAGPAAATRLRELLRRRYPRARADQPVLPMMVVEAAIAGILDQVTEATVIDTACASSLYAVDFGVKALLAGDCDIAYCGGVEVLNPTVAVMFAKLGGLSRGGAVRSFDASADGTLFSDGAAVVTLKLLSRARADGDQILGVLTGFGAAADGRGKAIAAPNPAGQRLAIERARGINETSPAAVDWIVAHATGTTAGDRTELQTLAAVAPPDGYPCSSNKAVVGHTGWAAGAVSLIHAAEALRAGRIPGQYGFTAAPADVPTDRTRVSDCDTDFPADPQRPRLVGISAFGFGGTNGHLLVTDRPNGHRIRSGHPIDSGDLAVVAWSAHLPGDPDRERIIGWLRGHDEAPDRRFAVPYPAPAPAEIRLTPKTIATIDPCHLMAVQVADTFLREHGELWAEVRESTGVITAHTGVPVALADAITRTYGDDVLAAIAESDAAQSLTPLVESILAAVRARVPECNEDTYAGVMTNVIASRITSRHNLRGMSVAIDAGDESAAAALSTARRYLQTGDLKLALLLALNGNSSGELAEILGRPADSLAEGAFLIAIATAAEADRRGWPILARLSFARGERDTAADSSTDAGAVNGARDYLGAAGAIELLRAVEGAAATAELSLPNGDRVQVQTPSKAAPERLTERYVSALVAAPHAAQTLSHSAIPEGSVVLAGSADLARQLRAELAAATVLCAGVDEPSDRRVQALIDQATPALTVIGDAADLDAQLRLHDLTFVAAQRLWPRWTTDSSLMVLLPGQPATGRPAPSAALFTGFVKSLAWERTGARISAVLTDAPPSAALPFLARERSATTTDSVVWYRNGIRYRDVLTPTALPATDTGLPLSDDSVILVTGGTGGLPIAMLRALSEHVKPSVWLLARTDPTDLAEQADGVPPADLRAALIRRLREDDPARPIRSIVEQADAHMKALARQRDYRDLADLLGADRLHCLSCDVLDPDSVRAAVATVLSTAGRLDLVIHAAGLSEPALLENKSFQTFRAVRDTKVLGYRHLKAALAEHAPIRWCNIGSVAGAIGLPGDVDYAAANDFLAACGQGSDEHEFTVAFPLWGQTGLRSDQLNRAYLQRQGQLSSITTAEGTGLFLAELRAGTGCAVFLGDNELRMLRSERPHTVVEDAPDEIPRFDTFLGEPARVDQTQGCWRYVFDPVRDDYLSDHLVDGKPTVPGTLMLEIAARAAMALLPGAIVHGYRNTRFEAFIKPFAGRSPIDLQITAALVVTDEQTTPTVTVELTSRRVPSNGAAQPPRRRFFRTEVILSTADSVAERPRTDVPDIDRPVQDPYLLADSPVHIGGLFANLTDCRAAGRRSVGTWSLPSDAASLLGGMRIPWLLLDAMLRTVALAAGTDTDQPVFVPREIGWIDLAAEQTNDIGMAERYGADIRLLGDLTGDATLRAIAPDGTFLLEMTGLTMEQLGSVRPTRERPTEDRRHYITAG